MKTTAQLRYESSKAAVVATKGKSTTNPLQLAGGPEEELLQKKKNPLQLAGAEEEELQMKRNPLQLAGAEEELQMKKSPVQLAGPEEELQMKKNPVQLAGAEEEELQMKQNPVQLAGAEEEELQMKQNPAQLAGAEEEELQMKKSPVQLRANPLQQITNTGNPMQLAAIPSTNPFQLEGAPTKENKTGLPDRLKSGIENLSGMDISDVKVHYNSSQPAQLNALAYAQGTDIHVGPGQEKHLPHEAWHVVQQMQGRVQPTVQMKEGVAVNDDPGLENEADVMGGKALQMKAVMQDTTAILPFSPDHPVQRITEEEIVQASIIILSSATRHGYTEEGLTSIVRNRYAEIQEGTGSIRLGLGADERTRDLGRLVYSCTVSRGVHRITVFHAHGGQTEGQNPRGY